MAELSVSVPYGGGAIRTFSNRNDHSGEAASAYCWLGGESTDKNLFMQVRLQRDPDFAIIDIFTKPLRDMNGTTLVRSQVYALGGNAFSTGVDDNFEYRSINLERLNSTTAVLRIPYNYNNSTLYVIEVDESTGICTTYIEEITGGITSLNTSAHNVCRGYQLFMKNVEDNVLVYNAVNYNSGTFLCQAVWDPVAKTLDTKNVASNNHNSVNLSNFQSQRYRTNYGSAAAGNGIARNSIGYNYWGNSNIYSVGFISAVQGRDGKWYFREARSHSTNYVSISGIQDFAFVYIPTSMGGDLATSGYSQSWGLLGGLNTSEGLDNQQARLGNFLPINVKECTTANGAHTNIDYQHNYQFPTFHAESYIELGHSQLLVHIGGAPQTKMFYTDSYTDTGSQGSCVWASWLDSNHFAIHGVANAQSSNYSYHSNNNYIRIIQYVDENYVVSEGAVHMQYHYMNQSNNQSAQWTKIDNYTVIGNGHNYILNFWAPE